MDFVATEVLGRPLTVIGLGDSFQSSGGLSSLIDLEFTTSFTDPYFYDTLQVPWFNGIGNMDYTDTVGCGSSTDYEQQQCPLYRRQIIRSPEYQIDPRLRERDSRWYADRYYSVRITDDIEIFFADTSVFVTEYYEQSWAYDVQGGLAYQDPEEQLAFLDGALANSTAVWKFIVGHHPIHSNGFSGGYPEVAAALDPLIEQYNVTAYLNGHDHSMQHIIADAGGLSTSYFTSGAGSVTHKGFTPREPALFESDVPGFTAFVFDTEGVTAYFFDGNGTGLYNYTIPLPQADEGAPLLASAFQSHP